MGDSRSGRFKDQRKDSTSKKRTYSDSTKNKEKKEEKERRERERNPSPPDFFEEEKKRKRSRKTEGGSSIDGRPVKKVKFDVTKNEEKNHHEFNFTDLYDYTGKKEKEDVDDIIKKHEKIFVDTIRELKANYSESGEEECAKLTGVDFKGIEKLERSGNSAIDNIKKRRKKMNNYQTLMKKTEEALDILNNLK